MVQTLPGWYRFDPLDLPPLTGSTLYPWHVSLTQRMLMQTERKLGGSLVKIEYNYVWCTKRSTGVLVSDVKARLEELIPEKLADIDCNLIALEIHGAYVRMKVSAPENISPLVIIHNVKKHSSHFIRKEFPQVRKMPSLWTRIHMVQTGPTISSSELKSFLRSQKLTD